MSFEKVVPGKPGGGNAGSGAGSPGGASG